MIRTDEEKKADRKFAVALVDKCSDTHRNADFGMDQWLAEMRDVQLELLKRYWPRMDDETRQRAAFTVSWLLGGCEVPVHVSLRRSDD